MASERSPRRLSSKVRDKEGDQNRRHRPLDVSATSDSKPEAKNSSEVSVMKGNELGETTEPAGLPRSRSHLQHDGRGSTAQDGRRSGRRVTPERGKGKDSRNKDQATRRTVYSDPNGKERPGARAGESRISRHDRLSEAKNADPPSIEREKWKDSRDKDQATCRTEGSDPNIKERPEARAGESRALRHDRLSEAKNADPPSKKRRQFREEKLPPESEPVGNAVPEPSKDSYTLNTTRDAGRQEERDRSRRPLERSDYGRAYGRARSFSNGERVDRADLLSRDRFSGGLNGSRYWGMDKFGGRKAYQPSGGREEKWKHDLYDETNRSPTKNEEDPVAKVEALLSL